MNRIIALVFAALVLCASCKKKNKEEETPTPMPAPVTYEISAKINGELKGCNSCYGAVYSGGYRDCVLNLNSSTEQIWITWDSIPVVGTYTLKKYGRPSVSYQKSGSFYNAVSGTLNLTSVATSTYGDVNQMAATFSFKTDTMKGLSFDISEGKVNAKK